MGSIEERRDGAVDTPATQRQRVDASPTKTPCICPRHNRAEFSEQVSYDTDGHPHCALQNCKKPIVSPVHDRAFMETAVLYGKNQSNHGKIQDGGNIDSEPNGGIAWDALSKHNHQGAALSGPAGLYWACEQEDCVKQQRLDVGNSNIKSAVHINLSAPTMDKPFYNGVRMKSNFGMRLCPTKGRCVTSSSACCRGMVLKRRLQSTEQLRDSAEERIAEAEAVAVAEADMQAEDLSNEDVTMPSVAALLRTWEEWEAPPATPTTAYRSLPPEVHESPDDDDQNATYRCLGVYRHESPDDDDQNATYRCLGVYRSLGASEEPKEPLLRMHDVLDNVEEALQAEQPLKALLAVLKSLKPLKREFYPLVKRLIAPLRAVAAKTGARAGV